MSACGKHKEHVSKALAGKSNRTWANCFVCLTHITSPRDAIECLKRALIGADPHETKINLQLAKLYHDLEEYAEASAYHRRIVEISIADGISNNLVMRWTLRHA
jgi:anaphase-promoting complex subunit 8